MQGGQGTPAFPAQLQGTGQARPQYSASAARPAMQQQQNMVPGQAPARVSQSPAGPVQPNAYQYQQQQGQAQLHQQHQQYLQAQSHMATQQGQYRQQQQQQQQQQSAGQAQKSMQPGMQQGARVQQAPRPPATQYTIQQQQQLQQQQQQQQQQQRQQQQLLQQQQHQQPGAQAQQQAQARPAQGAVAPPNPDPQVVARLLQNMPTADVIGRTLGIDKAGTESLLSDGKQGRLYLARQLAVRQTGPGGALLQTAPPQQQPAGVQGQQVRRASPAPTVNNANPAAARRGPGGPYQAAPAGQQLQGAGPVGGVQATGVMGGQHARLNQGRAGPYFNPQQASYAQQPGSYPNPRPGYSTGFSQVPSKSGTPTGGPVPAGSVSMNQQGNTFIVSSQPRPQLGQAGVQAPPRIPIPQPPPLTEDDKKFLNKPAMQQLLAKVGGPKLHMKPEVEAALSEMTEDLVGQALSFGCSMARRRQGAAASAEDLTLQAADVAAFLEHTWQLHVPGFSGQVLRPYKRPAASELHKTRAAAVRRALATTTAGSNSQAEAS